MSEAITCVFCGAPVNYFYEGSSDHVFECTEGANICGARVSFWVHPVPYKDEVAEAKRRYACVAPAREARR